MKVVGRIAGQMITMIYALLKTDQELLQSVAPGGALPAPMLYDPAVHKAHREGQYRPLKPKARQGRIIQLPKP